MVFLVRSRTVENFKFMCKTLALLSLDSVSQTSLQQWAGLFCFGAGFRRPLFSIVQEIFPFIQDPRWETADRLPCPESGMDDMILGALLIPFAGTNLRAPIRNNISCPDAPGQGGAAAESSSFISGLCRSTSESADDWHSSLTEESLHSSFDTGAKITSSNDCCDVCKGVTPSFGRWALCPRRCNKVLCSIECHIKHCQGLCFFPDPGLYRFGESFCGARAPLTWAYCCEGNPVVAPFDQLYNPDRDFSAESGKELLRTFESETALMEHWGPDCKLMSRARGNSCMWIEGPKAVRSGKYPLGLPWLPPRTQARVRKSNAMFRYSLRRLHLRLRNVGVAVIEHPVRSFGWKFPEAIGLSNSNGTCFTVFGNCCFGGERQKCTAFLNSCPRLHRALHKPTCGGHDFLKPFEVHELEDGCLSFDIKKEAEYLFNL